MFMSNCNLRVCHSFVSVDYFARGNTHLSHFISPGKLQAFIAGFSLADCCVDVGLLGFNCCM